jgi:hypothetical protein
MAAKTGLSVYELYANIQQMFRQWSNRAGTIKNDIDTGSPIPIDAFVMPCYHDARRAIETLTALRQRVIDKGWAAQLSAISVEEQGAGYDVVAEGLVLMALLQDLQALTITAVGGVDANGYITAPYIKLDNTTPFFATVDPVDYAPVVAKLSEIEAIFEE